MRTSRTALAALGVTIWGFGLYVLLVGNSIAGGALIVAGGLCLVIAAARGWGSFMEGLSNWLYFWR